MNKAQLIRLIYYKNASLNQNIIMRITDLILRELAIGGRNKKIAEIRHFGTFSNRQKRKRTLVHPATGRPITASAYCHMHYAYSQKAIDKLSVKGSI
jgi:nucleoid DNA-binding protein